MAAQKAAELELVEGHKTLMSTPASRRVVWDILGQSAIYQVARVVEHGALAFTEGRRSAALELMHQMLTHCPELYDRMVVENRHRLSVEKRQAEQEDNDQ